MINLIDVSGFIYRAFYGLPSLTHNETEVGALYGFCSAMLKITSKFPDTMFIATLDSGKKTFRNEIYKDYKANRKSMPEELVSQIGLIKEACEKFGFYTIQKPGFEADDIIATYAKKIANHKINVISSDKDLMQLLGENVTIYDPMKQKYITDDDVFKKFGVLPDKVLDVLSLMGDASDNIPGVPGIGPKTAAILINEFGSLNGLIENLDSLPKSKRNDVLKQEIDKALLSRELAKLKDDLDLDFNYEISQSKNLDEFLAKFGFRSLIKKQETQNHFFKEANFKSQPHSIGNEVFIYSCELNDEYLHTLKNELENNVISKVSDDSKQLIKMCFENGIDIKNTIDVSVLSYCIFGTKIKHDLESMQNEYLSTEVLDKLSRAELESIYRLLLEKLDDKTNYLFFEIENKLTEVLAKMEYAGIKIDIDYLKDLDKYFQSKIDDLTKSIHEIAGMEFNIASPKQVAFVLYEKLGFQKVGKKESTDAETLASFSGEYDGITDKILKWRGYSKLLNTYVKSLMKLADNDSKVHTTYSQTVVNTGRLSSSDPNLQNIPARTDEGLKIRKAFIATENHKLISFDYSQMELRLLAHMSNCEKLKKAFLDGKDIHKTTATHIFNVSDDLVTKEQRRIAKEINFSILYGMSLHTLSQKLDIPYGEASNIYSGFMGLYPEISEYMRENEEFAKQNGYVETILGRKCFIPLINNKNKNLVKFAKRQAINAPIQGSNADIIKLAMVKINENRRSDFEVLLQIHDELILEVSNDKIDETIDFVKRTMECAVTLDIPLLVDIKVSQHL